MDEKGMIKNFDMLRAVKERTLPRLDPELGSRLYSLSRSTPQRMAEEARELIEEALAPMAGIRLLEVRCRYEPAADKAELDCRFSWSGQELETTLEV